MKTAKFVERKLTDGSEVIDIIVRDTVNEQEIEINCQDQKHAFMTMDALLIAGFSQQL